MDLLYLYDDLTARREVYDSVGLSFVVKYKLVRYLMSPRVYRGGMICY